MVDHQIGLKRAYGRARGQPIISEAVKDTEQHLNQRGRSNSSKRCAAVRQVFKKFELNVPQAPEEARNGCKNFVQLSLSVLQTNPVSALDTEFSAQTGQPV